jgi:hypothetical protein
MLTIDKKEHYRDKVQRELADVIDDMKTYEPLIISEEERGLYQNFRTNWDRYTATNTQVMELVRQNKEAEAKKLMQAEGSTHYEEAAKYLEQDMALNVKFGQEAAKRGADTYSSSRYSAEERAAADVKLRAFVRRGSLQACWPAVGVERTAECHR